MGGEGVGKVGLCGNFVFDRLSGWWGVSPCGCGDSGPRRLVGRGWVSPTGVGNEAGSS